MKPNWTTGLVSELIRSEKVFDDNAETIAEMSERTGLKRTLTERAVAKLLKEDKIEQVWKRGPHLMQKAYRIKRHAKKISQNSSRD
jgi:hypothetical protein